MRRFKGRTSNHLFEELLDLKKLSCVQHFWARDYFCAAAGQMTDEMDKLYLEQHFEPIIDDNFKMEPVNRRRLVDAYPDLQDGIRPHRF